MFFLYREKFKNLHKLYFESSFLTARKKNGIQYTNRNHYRTSLTNTAFNYTTDDQTTRKILVYITFTLYGFFQIQVLR